MAWLGLAGIWLSDQIGTQSELVEIAQSICTTSAACDSSCRQLICGRCFLVQLSPQPCAAPPSHQKAQPLWPSKQLPHWRPNQRAKGPFCRPQPPVCRWARSSTGEGLWSACTQDGSSSINKAGSASEQSWTLSGAELTLMRLAEPWQIYGRSMAGPLAALAWSLAVSYL